MFVVMSGCIAVKVAIITTCSLLLFCPVMRCSVSLAQCNADRAILSDDGGMSPHHLERRADALVGMFGGFLICLLLGKGAATVTQ